MVENKPREIDNLGISLPGNSTHTSGRITDHLSLKPLDRIEPPSTQVFFDRYVKAGKPVVLAGAASSWPCVKKWSLAYLADHCGKNEVTLRHIEMKDKSISNEKTLLANYLEDIQNDRHTLEYLAQLPAGKVLPQLLSDIPSDPYTGIKAEDTSIMLGADSYAPCHFHNLSEAVSTQVAGRRRFLLFAPDQTRYLYAASLYEVLSQQKLLNFSRVDFLDGSIDRWPLVKHVHGFEAFLEPGDSIYIPIHYWHTVFSVDGFSILFARFFPSSWKRWHRGRLGLQVAYGVNYSKVNKFFRYLSGGDNKSPS